MANGNNKVSNLITRAKTSIILDHVFFATLLLRLEFIEDETISTCATNGKVIKYSPDYLSKLTSQQVTAIFCHELLHCVFCHHTRQGNRDHERWNVACDLAINPLLLEYGFQLPSGALIEPSLKGLTAEQIYDLIERDNNGLGKYKDADGDAGGMGTVEKAIDDNGDPAQSAEKKYQETDWKIAVTQAANLAKKAGNLPTGMQRLVEEHISPRLSWEEILYKYIDAFSYNDFSWNPPNRKYMNAGIYLPSVRSKELKNLLFACDASGSVRNAELGLIESALGYIADVYNPEMSCLWFDTLVHNRQDFIPGDIIKLKPVGGGGTDFKAPFNYITKNDLHPNVLIVFTDMECYSYPAIPEFPILWVTWKKHYDPPPFGEVIVM